MDTKRLIVIPNGINEDMKFCLCWEGVPAEQRYGENLTIPSFTKWVEKLHEEQMKSQNQLNDAREWFYCDAPTCKRYHRGRDKEYISNNNTKLSF